MAAWAARSLCATVHMGHLRHETGHTLHCGIKNEIQTSIMSSEKEHIVARSRRSYTSNHCTLVQTTSGQINKFTELLLFNLRENAAASIATRCLRRGRCIMFTLCVWSWGIDLKFWSNLWAWLSSFYNVYVMDNFELVIDSDERFQAPPKSLSQRMQLLVCLQPQCWHFQPIEWRVIEKLFSCVLVVLTCLADPLWLILCVRTMQMYTVCSIIPPTSAPPGSATSLFCGCCSWKECRPGRTEADASWSCLLSDWVGASLLWTAGVFPGAALLPRWLEWIN
jgi:hypothetical protein